MYNKIMLPNKLTTPTPQNDHDCAFFRPSFLLKRDFACAKATEGFNFLLGATCGPVKSAQWKYLNYLWQRRRVERNSELVLSNNRSSGARSDSRMTTPDEEDPEPAVPKNASWVHILGLVGIALVTATFVYGMGLKYETTKVFNSHTKFMAKRHELHLYANKKPDYATPAEGVSSVAVNKDASTVAEQTAPTTAALSDKTQPAPDSTSATAGDSVPASATKTSGSTTGTDTTSAVGGGTSTAATDKPLSDAGSAVATTHKNGDPAETAPQPAAADESPTLHEDPPEQQKLPLAGGSKIPVAGDSKIPVAGPRGDVDQAAAKTALGRDEHKTDDAVKQRAGTLPSEDRLLAEHDNAKQTSEQTGTSETQRPSVPPPTAASEQDAGIKKPGRVSDGYESRGDKQPPESRSSHPATEKILKSTLVGNGLKKPEPPPVIDPDSNALVAESAEEAASGRTDDMQDSGGSDAAEAAANGGHNKAAEDVDKRTDPLSDATSSGANNKANDGATEDASVRGRPPNLQTDSTVAKDKDLKNAVEAPAPEKPPPSASAGTTTAARSAGTEATDARPGLDEKPSPDVSDISQAAKNKGTYAVGSPVPEKPPPVVRSDAGKLEGGEPVVARPVSEQSPSQEQVLSQSEQKEASEAEARTESPVPPHANDAADARIATSEVRNAVSHPPAKEASLLQTEPAAATASPTATRPADASSASAGMRPEPTETRGGLTTQPSPSDASPAVPVVSIEKVRHLMNRIRIPVGNSIVATAGRGPASTPSPEQDARVDEDNPYSFVDEGVARDRQRKKLDVGRKKKVGEKDRRMKPAKEDEEENKGKKKKEACPCNDEDDWDDKGKPLGEKRSCSCTEEEKDDENEPKKKGAKSQAAGQPKKKRKQETSEESTSSFLGAENNNKPNQSGAPNQKPAQDDDKTESSENEKAGCKTCAEPDDRDSGTKKKIVEDDKKKKTKDEKKNCDCPCNSEAEEESESRRSSSFVENEKAKHEQQPKPKTPKQDDDDETGDPKEDNKGCENCAEPDDRDSGTTKKKQGEDDKKKKTEGDKQNCDCACNSSEKKEEEPATRRSSSSFVENETAKHEQQVRLEEQPAVKTDGNANAGKRKQDADDDADDDEGGGCKNCSKKKKTKGGETENDDEEEASCEGCSLKKLEVVKTKLKPQQNKKNAEPKGAKSTSAEEESTSFLEVVNRTAEQHSSPPLAAHAAQEQQRSNLQSPRPEEGPLPAQMVHRPEDNKLPHDRNTQVAPANLPARPPVEIKRDPGPEVVKEATSNRESDAVDTKTAATAAADPPVVRPLSTADQQPLGNTLPVVPPALVASINDVERRLQALERIAKHGDTNSAEENFSSPALTAIEAEISELRRQVREHLLHHQDLKVEKDKGRSKSSEAIAEQRAALAKPPDENHANRNPREADRKLAALAELVRQLRQELEPNIYT
ncbi:unnamed protein product [Amoebophrya sp. A120]|nr:unnamed protein product [Amoebophrya sp. A120]|eukprot:GSA120T00010368001.1